MKKSFLGFFVCLVFAVNPNTSYSISNVLLKPKKIRSTLSPQPNFERSSVELYQYTPKTLWNSKTNYLRFVISGYMYNFWLLYLNRITATPTANQRLEFYMFWTGAKQLENKWYRDLWSPIASSLDQIYYNFSRLYHPLTGLQGVLKHYLTSQDGFLNFYLIFTGQFRENNFFPMSGNYNEHLLQTDCREQGCVFQIPVIPDDIFPNDFYIGPTVNIMPNNSQNTYLKNFWREVIIRNEKIVRNMWPLLGIQVSSTEHENVMVKQVISDILQDLKQIFNTSLEVTPWITILTKYYDLVIPSYKPRGAAFQTLEIGFDYWLSKFDPHPYQTELKVELVHLTTS